MMNFNILYQEFLHELAEKNYVSASKKLTELKKNHPKTLKQAFTSSFLDTLRESLSTLSDIDMNLQIMSLHSRAGTSNDEPDTLALSKPLQVYLNTESGILSELRNKLVPIERLSVEEKEFLAVIILSLGTTNRLRLLYNTDLVKTEPHDEGTILDSIDMAQVACLERYINPVEPLINARTSIIHNINSLSYDNLEANFIDSMFNQYFQIILQLSKSTSEDIKSQLHVFLDEISFLTILLLATNHNSLNQLQTESLVTAIEIYISYTAYMAYKGDSELVHHLRLHTQFFFDRFSGTVSVHERFGFWITYIEDLLKSQDSKLKQIQSTNSAYKMPSILSFDTYFAQMNDYLSKKDYLAAHAEFLDIQRFYPQDFINSLEDFFKKNKLVQPPSEVSTDSFRGQIVADGLNFYQAVISLLEVNSCFYELGVLNLKCALLASAPTTEDFEQAKKMQQRASELFTIAKIKCPNEPSYTFLISQISQIYFDTVTRAYQNLPQEHAIDFLKAANRYSVNQLTEIYRSDVERKTTDISNFYLFHHHTIKFYFQLFINLESSKLIAESFMHETTSFFDSFIGIPDFNGEKTKKSHWNDVISSCNNLLLAAQENKNKEQEHLFSTLLSDFKKLSQRKTRVKKKRANNNHNILTQCSIFPSSSSIFSHSNAQIDQILKFLWSKDYSTAQSILEAIPQESLSPDYLKQLSDSLIKDEFLHNPTIPITNEVANAGLAFYNTSLSSLGGGYAFTAGVILLKQAFLYECCTNSEPMAILSRLTHAQNAFAAAIRQRSDAEKNDFSGMIGEAYLKAATRVWQKFQANQNPHSLILHMLQSQQEYYFCSTLLLSTHHDYLFNFTKITQSYFELFKMFSTIKDRKNFDLYLDTMQRSLNAIISCCSDENLKAQLWGYLATQYNLLFETAKKNASTESDLYQSNHNQCLEYAEKARSFSSSTCSM